eukprot:1141273-Pelagomonas_calceolata.AAC.11
MAACIVVRIAACIAVRIAACIAVRIAACIAVRIAACIAVCQQHNGRCMHSALHLLRASHASHLSWA